MKLTILAVLMALAFNAGATKNNPPNECGNHGNNCQPSGGSTNNNEANSNATGGAGGSGTGIGVGVGLGVGLGGEGGQGGAGGKGGDGGNAAAFGGAGGDATAGVIGSGNSSAKGGDASQGQLQGQQQGQQMGQGQSSTNVSGSKSIAQMASENTAVLKNQNANQSSAAGNTTTTVTNVGGDSTLVERNAPPVFLGNLTATMSCAGGFNAGASDRNGSGAFGFTWISADCRSVVIAREFVGIGMPDVGCRVFKTTKGYKRAVKADPSLANVDCTAKPAPAAVVAPVVFPLTDRKPRG